MVTKINKQMIDSKWSRAMVKVATVAHHAINIKMIVSLLISYVMASIIGY